MGEGQKETGGSMTFPGLRKSIRTGSLSFLETDVMLRPMDSSVK